MFAKLIIGKHIVDSGKKFDPVIMNSSCRTLIQLRLKFAIGASNLKLLFQQNMEFLIVTGRGRQGQMCFTTGVSKLVRLGGLCIIFVDEREIFIYTNFTLK